MHVLAGLEATGICVDQGVFEVGQQPTALGQHVASATYWLQLMSKLLLIVIGFAQPCMALLQPPDRPQAERQPLVPSLKQMECKALYPSRILACSLNACLR